MTARSFDLEVHAFRVWRVASSVGWDCTLSEVAEELDMPPSLVGRVLRLKGWRERIRDGRGCNLRGDQRDSIGGDRAVPVDVHIRRALRR
ncbi:MAG: hypothetical protein AAGC81_02315 [Pseudomonadota bacterium]